MERFVAQSTARLATQTLLKPDQLAAPVKMASLWQITVLAPAQFKSRMENVMCQRRHRLPLAPVVLFTMQKLMIVLPVVLQFLTALTAT